MMRDDDEESLAERLKVLEAHVDILQGRIIAAEMIARWYLVGIVIKEDDPLAQLAQIRTRMLQFLPIGGSPGEDAIRNSAIAFIAMNLDATEIRLRDALREVGRLPPKINSA